jgi:predicted SnoaL-like aldol condensation-catalyzing enzyme
MAEETMTPAEEHHTAFVLDAFDTLFDKRDYAATEGLGSSDYIEHSAHTGPGREGTVRPHGVEPHRPALRKQSQVATGDYVVLHGRYSNIGQPVDWVVDIVRVPDGLLAEHWDVIQDEATRETSRSGLPMFGDYFPDWTAIPHSTVSRPICPALTARGG